MPKLPPAKKIANSVALILTARICMCIVATVLVPGVGIAAKLFYDKLDSLQVGQAMTQLAIADLKNSLVELQTTQRLTGATRDAAILRLDDRVTFLERQGRK